MIRLFLSLAILLSYVSVIAQNATHIKGIVYGLEPDQSRIPLAGANLVWKSQQVGTVSENNGSFQLDRNPNTDTLIISYISYQSDTLVVSNSKELTIVLKLGVSLTEAEIKARRKSTTINHFELIQTERLGQHELGKAACCNLSESFETSPTVDVSFTDAITGTRQINMLGLAGPYSQLTRENMPDIRGLAVINGMGFIPGTWIESIQLIQGAGSVINGYESIAGQINTELLKPDDMDRFFINAYVNSDRTAELNTHIKIPLGKRWNSSLLLHGKFNNVRHDGNNDDFMDMPLNKRFVAMNRYEWVNPHSIHFEFGFRYTYLDQIGGQLDYELDQPKDSLHPWGMENEIRRLDAWGKFGKVNKKKTWQSTALQVAASVYQQDARYGLNLYSGDQQSVYLNFIHQSRIGSDKHVYKLGASYQYDFYDEMLNTKEYNRLESVPGIFAEYTYKPTDKFGVVLGMRADLHNEYGVFYTPRIHLRYELLKQTVLRASFGRGQRTANVLAEHLSVLASSRDIIIHSDNSVYGYGLNQEVAYNYGVNLTHTFELAYRTGRISTSFYRTDFQNQIVFDMEQGPREVHFYNLEGSSFANSFQFKVDYELINRLDVRVAYRYYDVKTTYMDELKEAPLLAPHRGFFNIAYSTKKVWKFDFTINVQGTKRIPSIADAGQPNVRPIESPVFALMNAQITKKWRNRLEVYIGGENIGNYQQQDPIISAENPYSPYFDASLIWGPIFGVKVYAGMRYSIK